METLDVRRSALRFLRRATRGPIVHTVDSCAATPARYRQPTPNHSGLDHVGCFFFFSRPPAFQSDSLWCLCPRRSGARPCRHLRRHLLFRYPAHHGNRHSCSFGRPTRGRSAADPAPGRTPPASPPLLGVLPGAAGSLAVTRYLAHLLFGISPRDPETFLIIPLALCAAALLASSLPARAAFWSDS